MSNEQFVSYFMARTSYIKCLLCTRSTCSAGFV